MDFHRAMTVARQGLDAWKAKPHNARWWRRIDGTPIPNDLLVNIAEAFVADAREHSSPRQVEREGSRDAIKSPSEPPAIPKEEL